MLTSPSVLFPVFWIAFIFVAFIRAVWGRREGSALAIVFRSVFLSTLVTGFLILVFYLTKTTFYSFIIGFFALFGTFVQGFEDRNKGR
jgi:hypothetical protein